MTKYCSVSDGFKERFEQFLQEKPVPALSLESQVVKHDFNNAGNGSAELKRTLKQLGIDPVILRRIAVASYEAEINLAAHSEGGTMRSNVHTNLVHIVFEDIGPGIEDVQKALEPGFSTAVEYVRAMGFGAGLGLPNIKKNSDAMCLDSAKGRNTVLEIVTFFE